MKNTIAIKKNTFEHKQRLFMFFKYFWLIVILPKYLQLIFLTVLLIYIIEPQKHTFSVTSMWLLGGVVIQLMAMALRIITTAQDTTRVFAAINTTAIWVIGVFFYEAYKNREFSSEELDYLHRLLLINLFVFSCLFVFSLFYKGNVIQLFGYPLVLKRVDYFSSGNGTRFSAFMDTPLSTAHMFQFTIPMLYLSSSKKRPPIYEIIITFIAYIGTMSGHSRMGMLTCTVVMTGYLLIILQGSMLSKKQRIGIMVLSAFIIALLTLIFYRQIINELYSLFNSRVGSNRARFALYKETIDTVTQESILFGIGIKEISSSTALPLGSHSTYLGLFFKSGIFGSALFLTGLISVVTMLIRNKRKSLYFAEIILMILPYFVFMISADIDGTDWVIVGVFSAWGLYSNKSEELSHR